MITAPPGILRKIPPAPRHWAACWARIWRWVLFLLVAAFLIWRVWLYFEVRDRISRIRSAGLPTSGMELERWRPSVPDAENGALVLTQSFALMRNFPDRRSNNEVDKAIRWVRTNDWPGTNRALFTEYVQANALALAVARSALLFPRFRYPLDTAVWPAELPHLRPLRELAIACELRAALDVDADRMEKWADDITMPLKLAGSLDAEPYLISQFLRRGIINFTVGATEWCLNHTAPNGDACQTLQEAFARAAQPTNLISRALVGERAMMIPAFRTYFMDAGKPELREPFSLGLFFGRASGFHERDLNFFLRAMDGAISTAGLPLPQNLALSSQMEAARVLAQKRLCFLSSMVLPEYSKATVSQATMEAKIGLAETALAVERFRGANGRLPDTLAALTPALIVAIPTDPFDGNPLRYQILGRGYRIYSIGPDCHDDGGREPPESRRFMDTNSYDITFTVER